MIEKIFNSFIQVYLASCIVPMPFWHLHFTSYAVFLAEIMGHSGIAQAYSPPYTVRSLLLLLNLDSTFSADFRSCSLCSTFSASRSR